ncbi:hypothetical protein DL769_005263 [Monosporascus sp. CRB-8-3]|nr:hypothetical protein DL769_005263 [Monosporascus sp. CRB-8-3]
MVVGGQVVNGVGLILRFFSTPLLAEVVLKRWRVPIVEGGPLFIGQMEWNLLMVTLGNERSDSSSDPAQMGLGIGSYVRANEQRIMENAKYVPEIRILTNTR